MNNLAAYFREFLRKIDRRLTRFRISSQQRKLAQAETELGQLGWQQVDFSSDLQREVEEIRDEEKVQARLSSQNAEFAQSLQELKQRRQEATRQFEEARSQLQSEKQIPDDALKATQKLLEHCRKEGLQAAARFPELDRELREAQLLYSKLLGIEPHTAQTREDLIRLRDRTISIPNEKADLLVHDARVLTRIKTLEAQLAVDSRAVSELENCLRVLESTFAESDRQLAAEIKAQEDKKKRIGKESESFEKTKATAYEGIGRRMADRGIAPINQPQALEAVSQCRHELAELQTALETSLKLSEQDPVVVPVSFYVALGGILLAGILVFACCSR